MNFMKKTLIYAAAIFVSTAVFANTHATPELEFVVQLHVTLGQVYSVGKTTHGTRTIIPITGGTFEGPNIKGEVLPGGAPVRHIT